MKWKETWMRLKGWQKGLILLRSAALAAILLSAFPHLQYDFDNTLVVLICFPVVCLSQAVLGWERDRKTAIFFLLAILFFFSVYVASAVC